MGKSLLSIHVHVYVCIVGYGIDTTVNAFGRF